MRYLITGASGMLGRDLQTVLAGNEITALPRAALDITDEHAVRDAVAGHDVVVNAAAYTKVDDAESHEDEAYAVNATGARLLARAAREAGARLVQISTDYVFDGAGTEPYPEDTPRDPLSAYGRTKAAGEEAVWEEHPEGTVLLRTAWLYGEHGPSFPRTMLTLAQTRETLSVVDDQVGQPTWTLDLARRIREVAERRVPAGIYHATNAGSTSWFGLARAVFAAAGLDPERVQPTDSSAFVRPAPRPAYSVLGHAGWSRAGLAPLRPWEDALREAMQAGILTP